MLNRVSLMGRLVADPEQQVTSAGNAVVSFDIAVERDSKNSEADFLRCVAWKGTAVFICNNFKKGQPIAIDGRVQSHIYKDNDGNNKKVVEILAEKVYFAGFLKSADNNNQSENEEVFDDIFEEFDKL